jgi:hypothetical protein
MCKDAVNDMIQNLFPNKIDVGIINYSKNGSAIATCFWNEQNKLEILKKVYAIN